MSRRQEARNQASPALGMRGYASPSPLPVFSPPLPEYAGSASAAAAAHAWWERAAAGSPNLSAPTDWVNDAQPTGGYVNLLQNPASFPFPQQIPSHPDMPHNYNLVDSSSHHTPLPPTQPSATKKTKKGASNKRTHSKTINLENGDDEELANKKRMTWTTKEDERLMSAWLSNSNDAISGNYKKNDQYWDAVTAEYNSNTSDNNRKRQMKQCMSRWHRVNKIVNDFHAVYIEMSLVYSSGQSDADLMDKVQYTVNGRQYDTSYYLADGIYPEWATFVKSIPLPQNDKTKLFAKHQEGARKDVEWAFAALQSRFNIVNRPTKLWKRAAIGSIMQACVIIHNMIVENERKPFNIPLDLNRNPEMSSVLPPEVMHGAHPVFEDVLRRSATIRDRETHIQLKLDLVENIWDRFGN